MSDVIRIRQDKSQPYCWLYTAPCVKNSFTYNIQCFLSQSWTAPTFQGTSKLQKNRLRGATRPSQGSQELQLSLCSGGKGWSYCIRNSAAAWATKILTCCINLCASWISYILLLSAICFSDLTLAVSVLLLKCTLRSRKYFLFWFLPVAYRNCERSDSKGQLWPRLPAAAEQQKSRCRQLLLLRGDIGDETTSCPVPLPKGSPYESLAYVEQGVRPVSMKFWWKHLPCPWGHSPAPSFQIDPCSCMQQQGQQENICQDMCAQAQLDVGWPLTRLSHCDQAPRKPWVISHLYHTSSCWYLDYM